AGCGPAAWCPCGAAPPTAGTATTASSYPAAPSCSPRPEPHCTLASPPAPPHLLPGGRGQRRSECCSSAPATACVPTLPRRFWTPRPPSESLLPARAATPNQCTRTLCG